VVVKVKVGVARRVVFEAPLINELLLTTVLNGKAESALGLITETLPVL
jgi:hypothetical protein